MICSYTRVFIKGDVGNFMMLSEKQDEEQGRKMHVLVDNALQLIDLGNQRQEEKE